MIAFLTSGLGRTAILSVVFLAVLASCGVQTQRLKHAKSDLATAKTLLYVPDAAGKPTRVTWQKAFEQSEANLTTCHTSVQNLEAGIASQNSALERLATEADRKGQELAQALQSARKVASAATSERDRILSIRAVGETTCQRLLDAERQISEGP